MLSEWVILLRLILAAVLSGVIGFEREFHGRAAGFRTHILLCLGSALVMLTSIHIFDVYYARVPCDPARMAAGVVTGIGFLGAGAIMHSRSTVRGLTTAGSLWVVAGLGLAVGSGLYGGAIATTALTIITLMIFSKIEHVMIRKDWYKTIVIEMSDGMDQLKSLRDVFTEYGCDITDFEVERAKDGIAAQFKVGLKIRETRFVNSLIEDVARLPGVKHAKWQAE
jgi:putative Mg2+ transporter-C (MgtC) family protein